MMYLPGIAFLFIASAIISIPFAMFVKKKTLSIFLSVSVSTLILKLWAYFVMDGFDLQFLIYVIVIGFTAAMFVNFGMNEFRKRMASSS